MLFDAARAVLNGTEDVVTRPDLRRPGALSDPPYIRRPEKELWREFELSKPRLLGALLDAASHGLRMLPLVRLERLSRMADFAIWATACETALWSSGTFVRAYVSNRRAAIDEAIEADPVSACVRELMAERASWAGSATDLLRIGSDPSRDWFSRDRSDWPKNPRALAGRLRRRQNHYTTLENTVCTVRDGKRRSALATCFGAVPSVIAADGTDGADAMSKTVIIFEGPQIGDEFHVNPSVASCRCFGSRVSYAGNWVMTE